jgi:uncharacterized protein (DUF2164 family)
MPIHLDDDGRAELVESLQGFWLTEFDEELSAFRADQVLRYLLELVGARMYNRGVQDARAWMLTRLDDLDGEVYEAGITPG